jgi:hypothetical protein
MLAKILAINDSCDGTVASKFTAIVANRGSSDVTDTIDR